MDSNSSGLRQRILDAAAQLFYRQGFRATSVKQITEGSEEGDRLLTEALERAGAGPAEQLHALVKATALYHTRHRALSTLGIMRYQELPAA